MTAPGAPVAASNDRTTLFGVLGIVFALCCPIIGIVFAILSMNEAKKRGNPQTLGIVGLVIAAANILINIVGGAAGWYSF
jgi:hypothetical protein